MSQAENYYNNVRARTQAFWLAYHGLRDAQTQWNALDYGNTLPPGEGENEGLIASDIGAVVFDTTNAVTTLLGQGHATNLAKLLP